MQHREPSFADPTNPNIRKQRMEALLSSWRRYPNWLQVDGPVYRRGAEDETGLTAEDTKVWRDVLRTAEPVPPRTLLQGLRSHAELAGVSVDDLVRDRAVMIVGDRVACRWRKSQGGAVSTLEGHQWTLRVRAADYDAARLEAVLRRRFGEVELRGEIYVARIPLHGSLDAVTLLLECCLEEPDLAYRAWRVSRALEIGDAFLSQLTASVRRSLAASLANELSSALASLSAQVDLQLEWFAEGIEGSSAVEHRSGLPPSRLTALLEAEFCLQHSHQEIADQYYEDLAWAFALVGECLQIGELLKQLPPGRTFEALVDAIAHSRPEMVATYVWHPAFHAEGAFALLQLSQQIQYAPSNTLELHPEWLEVQRLGRAQILLGDRLLDPASALALGVRDEGQSLVRTHVDAYSDPFRPQALDSQTIAELWRQALSLPDRKKDTVDALECFLAGDRKLSDAAMAFGLRIVGVLREIDSAEAARAARAIVSGYVSSLMLQPSVFSLPDLLPAIGPPLDEIRATLASSDPTTYAKWLRPFDLTDYLQRARSQEPPDRIDSRTVTPFYDVPRAIRSHTHMLIAQALTTENFELALDAALECVAADVRADIVLHAFSWSDLAQTTEYRRVEGLTPLFVGIGMLLSRSERGLELLSGLLACDPEAHILAYVRIGARDSEPLTRLLDPVLRNRLNAELSAARGIALGHALELASILHQAELPRESERFARKTIEICCGLESHHRQNYLDAAYAILAGALAQQEMWAELVELDPRIDGRTQALFVRSVKAVALMELGKLDDARVALSHILEEEPHHHGALINLTACLVRAEDWLAAIDAAERAKAIVAPQQWDNLLINEAIARDKVGDRFTADSLLKKISPRARRRPDIQELQSRVGANQHGRPSALVEFEPPATGSVPKSAVDVPESAAPRQQSEPIDVAIITALDVEYNAVRERLTECRAAPKHEQIPDMWGWTLGTIAKTDGSGAHRVVLAMAGRSGNLQSFMVTLRTVNRWQPRYVVFSGIAGGLDREGLAQGDVVLSESVWFYDYGKIDNGRYVPRHRDLFAVDASLFNSAVSFHGSCPALAAPSVVPPRPDHTPKLVKGLIGSGDKVIDDLSQDFAKSIVGARPDLQAVEMEAAGACAAIQYLRDEGRNVGFIMVRGISDMPKALPSSVVIASGEAPLSQTQQRDNWKPYASAIAARFVVDWIASDRWPLAPRSASQGNGAARD
ncbi:MAG: 5'-methylthioadenosine/S-adenosylhomocysteine nucleosidase [Deltaproteobacteria bacterium]|nr:5'-methylthioadenosine/S-adenosylhomocysteine nucleosidase [Deltaproteobacteria bacterium]